MTRPHFLFLLYLFIVSDIVASAVSGYMLWTSRRINGEARLVTLMALMMGAIFVDGSCQLVANAIGFDIKPVYKTGFAWWYWSGRAVRSVAIWALTLRLVKGK